MDHNRILSMLIHIYVSHTCRFILEDFPVQVDVSTLHFCFQSVHSIIVAHLTNEPALPCKFTDCDSLIRSFATIGSHVFE